MRRALLAIVVLLVSVEVARGQAPPPAPAKAVLANLAWMTGSWIDDSGGNLSEEIWTAPSGDSMMGMWRYVEGGKTRIYELLTIRVDVGGIEMLLRHFDPKMIAREDKETPAVLKLVSWKEREAVFEGLETGAAGRVSLRYRRPTDDTLTCTLEKNGKKEEFSFRKAPQGFVH